MDVKVDDSISYIDTFEALKWAYVQKYDYISEEEQLDLMNMTYSFIDNTINEVLLKNKTQEKEEYIRKLCKFTIKIILPKINKKIYEYNLKRSENTRGILDSKEMIKLNNWLDLEDNFYAIASMRSLYHLALYLERDDAESQKVWCYIIDDVMGGIFYSANQMILNNKYQNLIKQCPTGYGKCCSEDTMVFSKKGYIKISELNIGDYVYSMENNKLVENKITNIWHSSKKQVKIFTRSGANIIVSPEHRMYTQRGYVEAKNITCNDYLYELCSKVEYGIKIDENELKFISMMIFDGSCTNNTSFCKQDNEIYKECINVCNNLKFKVKDYYCKNKNCNNLYIYNGENNVHELLKKYGLYNHYANDKRLPKQFLNLCLQQRYDFIGIMLATDGYIPYPNSNGGNNIGITLSSKELCEDIQKLLFTCGIYSNINKKNIKLNNKKFNAWSLTIPDEFLEIIYNNCYCYQKQERLIYRYNYYKNLKNKSYSNSVNYPKEVLEGNKNFKKIVNKQWKRNKTFKREIVHKYISDENIISKDFVWNKIISIEYDDTEIPMVDIEVQNTHNFIANNLVSHNSKSDCVIISYILGYDPNATIMKVVGNPKLVGEITQNITKMLLSPRFGKVFKEFGKCQGKENEMFTTIKQTDGTFKLKWSKQARSFLCVNKDTAIDGTRYDYQFYDDVTQSKDKENVTQHMKDRSSYTSQWKKRASSEFTTKRFFTGTAYHREDFLSYIKDYYSSKLPLVKELELSKFKWSKFTKVSSDRKTVYIIVPKLANLELGESKAYCTFPQRFSKKEALDMLHGNLGSKREFYAMEQQTPLPPEKLCFDWAYLNQYDRLPEDIVNRQSLSKIIIDPSRKGYDNFSALVFEKSSIENTSKWYFTSCFYEQVSSKVAIPEVADLIIDHKCTTIYAESNIDISDLLEVELHKKNYYDYEIITFYSYEKKEDKISRARDDIRDNILFPVQGMYHFESPMGRALTDIVNYSLEGKNKHDDSPDCCAMFTIQEQEEKSNTIDILPINFRF